VQELSGLELVGLGAAVFRLLEELHRFEAFGGGAGDDPGLVAAVELLEGRRQPVPRAARGADALAIVTEWNEFRNMDLARLRRLMRRPVLCDLRNIYDPDEVESAGMRYVGVGRGRV